MAGLFWVVQRASTNKAASLLLSFTCTNVSHFFWTSCCSWTNNLSSFGDYNSNILFVCDCATRKSVKGPC